MGREEEEAAVAAVREVIGSKRLFRHFGVSANPFERSRTRDLEKSFAAMAGTEHALAVNSGTSALVCGLVGMGIGPGDEVIVPAYTWFSTASAVMAVGAVPVVAEVDASLTLDPEDARRKISPRRARCPRPHARRTGGHGSSGGAGRRARPAAAGGRRPGGRRRPPGAGGSGASEMPGLSASTWPRSSPQARVGCSSRTIRSCTGARRCTTTRRRWSTGVLVGGMAARAQSANVGAAGRRCAAYSSTVSTSSSRTCASASRG